MNCGYSFGTASNALEAVVSVGKGLKGNDWETNWRKVNPFLHGGGWQTCFSDCS